MPLVYEAKGDYESALEHLVLGSMLMVSNGQDNEVAAIDVGIGDIYLFLCFFDEADFLIRKLSSINLQGVKIIFRWHQLYLYYKTGNLRE